MARKYKEQLEALHFNAKLLNVETQGHIKLYNDNCSKMNFLNGKLSRATTEEGKAAATQEIENLKAEIAAQEVLIEERINIEFEAQFPEKKPEPTPEPTPTPEPEPTPEPNPEPTPTPEPPKEKSYRRSCGMFGHEED
jgi:outer membrane biosynthesis protein TonB